MNSYTYKLISKKVLTKWSFTLNLHYLLNVYPFKKNLQIDWIESNLSTNKNKHQLEAMVQDEEEVEKSNC